MEILFAVTLGFILDMCFGDPHWMPHPVVYIGNLITKSEKVLRAVFPATKAGERAGGTILVILVLGVTGIVGFGLPFLLGLIHPAAGFALQVFWSYQVLATRCLKDETMKVQDALQHGSLDDARLAVSWLVSRDTQELSAEGVTKAAVETAAENTNDGVIAPLMYLMIGGAGLGLMYKAVNTMDSQLGYMNERYRYFGTAAARLDDVCGYIPARISALMMICAAFLQSLFFSGKELHDGKKESHVYQNSFVEKRVASGKNAFRIWRRDRRKHKSPNSAQTESACAGALGIQLAGDACYFGEVYHKPFIGDRLRPIEAEDIKRTCDLMYGSAFEALLLFGGLRAAAVILLLH